MVHFFGLSKETFFRSCSFLSDTLYRIYVRIYCSRSSSSSYLLHYSSQMIERTEDGSFIIQRGACMHACIQLNHDSSTFTFFFFSFSLFSFSKFVVENYLIDVDEAVKNLLFGQIDGLAQTCVKKSLKYRSRRT